MTIPIMDQKGVDAESSTVSYLKDIEDRILHLLEIYPKISPSMLQIGIGSSLPPKIWRPVLQSLIDRKLVVQDVIVNVSTPKGRSQSHTIISLAKASSVAKHTVAWMDSTGKELHKILLDYQKTDLENGNETTRNRAKNYSIALVRADG